METTYTTDRLKLREHKIEDGAFIDKDFEDFDTVKNTLTIPYPFPKGEGEEWIKRALLAKKEGKGLHFAITLKDKDEPIGSVGLYITKEHKRAELGYWISKAYWNQGYATEAARKIIEIGFENLDLNCIIGSVYTTNLVSCKVLEKIGMKHDGILRKHIIRFGEVKDDSKYSILKEEYEATKV